MPYLTFESAARVTERLSRELLSRRPDIQSELAYYKGEQGALKFASEKFRKKYTGRYKGFSDNWCQPVADAGPERMTVLGIRPWASARADDATNRAWERSEAAAGMQTALICRAAARRSFAMVAPGRTDDTPRITFENPDSTIVDTDPATKERRYGLVMWVDDKMEYATLYTPLEIYKFKRETHEDRYERQGRPVDLTAGWQPRGDDAWASNPFQEVPIVEFANADLLDDQPRSDIRGVMAMQDSINLIWAYLLNSLDQASMPQRIITNAAAPEAPILDAKGQVIGRRPIELDGLVDEKILWVPGEAKAQFWPAAQLEPFSKVIDQAVEHIASQTRTPPHYLMAKMVNTAAEALTISEAGLVSKVRQAITQVNPGVRAMYRLMALAMRRPASEVERLSAGKVMWADIQYRSEAQRADSLVKKRQMGYPMEWILEQDGNDPEQVARIMEMIRTEQAQDPLAAAHYAGSAAGPQAPEPGPDATEGAPQYERGAW